MKLLRAICDEPYRLFFPLGILAGMVGVGHWLWYDLNFIPKYSGLFHSSIQMMVYVNCFVVGFMGTAIPRFTGTRKASPAEVAGFLLLFAGMVICVSLGKWIAAESFYIVWLIFLMVFVGTRLVRRVKTPTGSGAPPFEMMWIPLGALQGIVGTALLILGRLEVLPRLAASIGKPLMDQGFLLCVVMGIGGFLIPRLMGTYAKNVPGGHDEELCEPGQGQKPACGERPPARLYLFLSLVFFASFILEGMGFTALGYASRAFVLTLVFIRTRVIPGPPKSSDFYIKLVWISVWMVLIGLWGTAVFPDFRVICLHFSYIGGLSLMVFAVATMVILSHAGEGESLHKPLWILWLIGLGLALALTKRAIVAFFPDKYFAFLGMASGVWLVVAVTWLIFILPRIFRIPADDEFGKLHDDAVKKVRS